MKRLLFAVSIAFIIYCGNAYAQEYDINKAINETAGYIIENADNPTAASVGGDWAIFALSRCGCDIPDEYINRYLNNVSAAVAEKQGILHERKYTEYSRVILGLTSVGADPRNIGGFDIIKPLEDYERTISQGINGAVFALLAADSQKYELSSRNAYLDYIISSRCPDGGFALGAGSSVSDTDITALAISALAKYKNDARAAECIESALDLLSRRQNENGGFGSALSETCETTAQVITAMCEAGIPLDDPAFVKNGKTTLDDLMSYYIPGGGFAHSHSAVKVDQMSSEQGLYALAAVKRASEGKNTLYDMTDVNTENTTALSVPSVKHFDDIADESVKNSVDFLVSAGIINGKTENTFEPQSTVTRAEFAAIISRTLNITLVPGNSYFNDVSENDWFFGVVNSAYEHGIIKGVSDTEFNPYGNVTREEAFVMIARAAVLSGKDDDSGSTDTADTLTRFSDHAEISDWAEKSAALCDKLGIIPYKSDNIMPQTSILRGETALMLYGLLGRK
ncbi:MAG: S-layer homology domain-containing protein [Oscillospiraceae bacterium]|nr:S-layer homology domain-containing protein [Oscillospiraceae bacterium]